MKLHVEESLLKDIYECLRDAEIYVNTCGEEKRRLVEKTFQTLGELLGTNKKEIWAAVELPKTGYVYCNTYGLRRATHGHQIKLMTDKIFSSEKDANDYIKDCISSGNICFAVKVDNLITEEKIPCQFTK